MNLALDTIEAPPTTEAINVRNCSSFPEAVNLLRKQPPGIVLLDSDNTIRKTIKEGKSGHFGRVPETALKDIDELQKNGWKIAVVTNQPYTPKIPGGSHQIARALSRRRKYEAFPKCFEQRGIRIFGGGLNFLFKHHKKTPKAVEKVAQWIDKQKEGFEGKPTNVVMIGDKPADVTFAKKLYRKIDKSPFINNFSMFKLPSKDTVFSQFIP